MHTELTVYVVSSYPSTFGGWVDAQQTPPFLNPPPSPKNSPHKCDGLLASHPGPYQIDIEHSPEFAHSAQCAGPKRILIFTYHIITSPNDGGVCT